MYRRVTFSSVGRRLQQRSISSSVCLQSERALPHFHANDKCSEALRTPKTVSVIGAPMTFGQPLPGTDGGPKLIRDAGLLKTLKKLGWAVDETGNLEYVAPTSEDPVLDSQYGKAKNCFAVGNGTKKLYEIYKKKAEEGKFCLVLGGDHTIGAGSLAGLLSVHSNAGVIWVDAHADINTPAGSGSGNMHGMPVSFLMEGMVDTSKLPGFEWIVDVPKMKPDQLVYIGLRDIDDFERGVLREKKIRAFTMQDVDRYGIGKVMEMALDHLSSKKHRPIHVSYDIDAVDPLIAPSTGTRVRGGLTWREANYVAEAVAETNQMVGLDMVEVNASLAPGDGAQITVDMALMLIASAMGNRIL
ncbi:unnamed protein product [Hyaloperonospora brassicae]|uniref:Arginase n=1 Tax=Hyaloperonospora brassicae TaxID=162125 RepID=A0AAV0V673_HYABA|nr:unnamed protein product [Hyaloperonospora brassicae]